MSDTPTPPLSAEDMSALVETLEHVGTLRINRASVLRERGEHEEAGYADEDAAQLDRLAAPLTGDAADG